MATDKQMEANQANAQKSTGPRTAEGKANSRRNAVKHGLASGSKVLPVEDETLYNERLGRWKKEANPESDMELYQLETAVRASVRLDRCVRHERAEVTRRRRRAVGLWEGTQTRRVNKIVAAWNTEPADCVARLEEFTRGCDWLLARWEELAEALEANESWTGAEAAMALRLLGKSPEMLHDVDREVIAFRTFAIAAQGELDPDEIDAFYGDDTTELLDDERLVVAENRLPGRDEAREALWEILNAELERLVPMRDDLWEHQDGPSLAEKIDRATLDDSPLGQLRRRYESASQLDMHRALKELAQQGRSNAVRREADREKAEEAAKRTQRREEASRMDRLNKLGRGSSRNEPIYEREEVKRTGAEQWVESSRTSPSPSASVDLAHLRPAYGPGSCTPDTSSEPEAEGESLGLFHIPRAVANVIVTLNHLFGIA